MSGRTLSRRQMLGWTAAAGAALLAACGGNAAAPASSAPAAGSGSTAASAAPASGSAGAAGAVPQSIDQLYEAAKKEANVTIWTPENPEPMQAMFADFNKRYPGIKLTYREQNTGSESVLLDIQSGKHTVDLSQSSMAVAQDLLNRNYLQTTGNWDKLFPDIPPSAIQSGGKLVAYFDI
ncbi:MAG: extracellular solute-binding protein, partial [Chloroflexi bacterium]|nr:extracellular solute-binding protein [Chloroflexota bacterium]